LSLTLDLNKLTDDQLLDLQLRDLPLTIKRTPLERRLALLYKELEDSGIMFKPHVWLSGEWFTPDGVAGFAIPFYLAHPRLIKLERSQMLEVEGGTERECLSIMRHETGHALDNAYRFHSMRAYITLFGSFRRSYPDFYRPKPNSRDYVLNLNSWYAQAHPAEDFAETFAVWLTPGSRWRRRYRQWPALRKLEFVDSMMNKIRGVPPPDLKKRRVEMLGRMRTTLREHYAHKRHRYGFAWPARYDQDLRRIFSDDPKHAACPFTATYLRKIRSEVRHIVALATGVHHYSVDQLIKQMIDRSTELKLRIAVSPDIAKQEVLAMLTRQTMSMLQKGYHRFAL
jgi:putative zinc-binding metallo-peptidase